MFVRAGKRTPGGRTGGLELRNDVLTFIQFPLPEFFFWTSPTPVGFKVARGFAFVCVCILLSFYLGRTRGRGGGGILLEDKTSEPDVVS